MDKRLCAAVAIGMLAAGAGWSGEARAAGCSPSGTSLALTAENHAFDKDCLAVPAGQAFTIGFDNRDSDRHNLVVLPSHTSTETLFQGDIVPGPKHLVYAVPALKAGSYHFHCELHPNLMNGMFIVAAAASAPTEAKPSTTPRPTMSMRTDTPAASPAPPMAPKPDAAPRTAASAPSPAGSATGTATAPSTAAATGEKPLPRTGPAATQLLFLLAGLALSAGGLSVFGAARRTGS